MSWRADFATAKDAMVRMQQAKIAHDTPSPMVLRVFQLDGEQLQSELGNSLKTQFNRMFMHFPSEGTWSKFSDELELLLQLLIFRFGFWDYNQCYGDRLQNLHHRDERLAHAVGEDLVAVATAATAPSNKLKLLYGFLTIIVPYAHSKLMRYTNTSTQWGLEPDDSNWKTKMFKLLNYAETALRVCQILNFLVFLQQGKYRNVIDRVLRMRLVYGKQRMNRIVNMEYMNQQMFIPAFIEFFAFLLPLLNFGKLWRMVRQFQGSISGGSGQSVASSCSQCHADPVVTPQISNCGHRYCYYCISSRCIVDGGSFTCPTCGHAITSFRPVAPRLGTV